MIDFLRFSRNFPTPIQEIQSKLLENKQIRLFVKREDLIHPLLSGNKFRKLKYNLMEARRRDYNALLSFGGAYSNHIHALAAAGKIFGFETVGIVRGERLKDLNPTLSFALNCGMKLHFVTRDQYRNKRFENLDLDLGSFYKLPEGGSNQLAIKGCGEIVEEAKGQLEVDFYCLSCGTGGTMAGIIRGLQGEKRVLGFSALKGSFLTKTIQSFLPEQHHDNWEVQNDYHFGGYAKFDQGLIGFINEFKSEYGIPLDPIYTGKMFFGIFDLIQKDHFSEGSRILLIHTGGLQGIQGFNQRFGKLIN